MLSKGFPVNPGDLATSSERMGSRFSPTQRNLVRRADRVLPDGSKHDPKPKPTAVKGNRRRQPWVVEKSYEPEVPAKVENPRAPARGGQGIHWREGVNRWTE